jgi:outer membrane receptor protein involved in Fe transport
MLAVAVVLLSRASGFAQEAVITTSPPPRIEERVDVVGVTPIHGIGLAESKVPANVQVFTADQLTTSLALDVPTLLTERAASVQVSDAQAGTFQPDLLFRGFVGSPLLGASEGLALYQDGVRLNDPFGDTVPWDLLPSAAIASINVIPGSNPLFGLNALGGALSIRTKDGFGFPGQRVSFATGSFARHRLEVESGAHGRSVGYFVAGALTDESGWRDFSPSTIRRVFGDVAWRGTASALNLSVTAASNDLTGNGAAPVDLLEDDRDAVFTHPDRTDNDIVLLTAKARRQSSDRLLLEAVAYYRHARTETFNGDAADGDDHEGEAEDLDDHEFGGVNNISDARGRGVGMTGQMTRTGPLWGRDNHFIAGAGADAATTQFEFATELAHLTPERGTIGSGRFDEDAAVDLESRVITGSAFATNTWSVTNAVSITGSARFNGTALRLRDQLGTALTGDHRFGRVNPAAGITYQARPWLNIYGSYTQSSRVPTPVELTCADPDDPCRLPNAFVSDPPLDQIVAATWEAGVRGAPRSIDWALAGFTTAATDDIIFVSSGTLRGEGHFENIATTERRGIEASVGYDVADRLSVFAAYTFQQATFGTDLRIASRFHPGADAAEISVAAGSRMPGVPAHTAKSGVAAVLTERLNVGVNVRMQSGQFLRGDEGNLLAPLPGFTLVNAHARHRVTRRVTAVVQAQNIFGAAFYTFGVLGDAESLLGDDFDDPRFYSPGAPRAAWVGLDVRF